jgi:hypothetical protein
MRLGFCTVALISGLTAGCPEDESDDERRPTSDGGATTDDAAAAGNDGDSGGSSGNTSDPSRCPGNLRNELLDAFGNINARICDVCFDEASTCPAAPFGGTAIECFIEAACHTAHLEDPARCLTGALATEHGMCNYEGEKSCDNDCYPNTLANVVRMRCTDPNLGAALSKCGFDLGD